MPYADPLTEEEIATALRSLPDWALEGDAIKRTVELPTFREAIHLVDAVADAAEEANHHPNIDIRWRRVTFVLTTHSARALTRRDVELASTIDRLVTERGPIESPGR